MPELFSHKPSREMQKSLGRQAELAARAFMYLYTHRACAPPDGKEKIDLSIDETRQSLVNSIIARIQSAGLEDANREERSKIINTMAKEDAANQDKISRELLDAGMLITIMNSVNEITHQYYEVYPDFQPLFELVNNLAKLVPPGLAVIFGDDLPIEIRRSFPRLSVLFEQNRAHGGIAGVTSEDIPDEASHDVPDMNSDDIHNSFRDKPLTSDFNSGNKMIWFINIVALLIAILPMPYLYYMALRILVCFSAVYLLVRHRERWPNEATGWVTIFGIIAVLYNPVFPIELTKFLWVPINLVTVVIFWKHYQTDSASTDGEKRN